jgi:hypothetical protein
MTYPLLFAGTKQFARDLEAVSPGRDRRRANARPGGNVTDRSRVLLAGWRC